MRFTVQDAASNVSVIAGDAPVDVVVTAFGDSFPQGRDALGRECERMLLGEGFCFGTPSGQRLYVRRVA